MLSIASNAWIGWITGIIPSRVRGRFFSILSQYLMLTAVGVGFGFSLISIQQADRTSMHIHLQPEQVLFGLTGIARWSAQIPLSLVRDRKSRPVTEAIAFFIREIKPRIMK